MSETRRAARPLGQFDIMPVLEMVMPFDRRATFPEQCDHDWAPYRSWLEPDALIMHGARSVAIGPTLVYNHS